MPSNLADSRRHYFSHQKCIVTQILMTSCWQRGNILKTFSEENEPCNLNFYKMCSLHLTAGIAVMYAATILCCWKSTFYKWLWFELSNDDGLSWSHNSVSSQYFCWASLWYDRPYCIGRIRTKITNPSYL